jgi:glycerate 2-kinase
LRHDLASVVRAAIDGVDAARLVQKGLEDPDHVSWLQSAAAVDVIAAGKAAGAMLNAFAAGSSVPLRTIVAVGTTRPAVLPEGTEWFDGGHPLPNDASVAAAARALAVAAQSGTADLLLVLLSGGGSALMARPAEPVKLSEKQQTAKLLMEQGADIYELNTVRKHLSGIKGGQLAVAAAGRVLTLAISDVVGDDLSVIASGPTVADDSSYAAALEIVGRRGGADQYPRSVIERLQEGMRGAIPETPASGDVRLARSKAKVIGPQRGALDGARTAAELLGYHVHVHAEPVTGEAREAAVRHVDMIAERIRLMPRPCCVLSAGETTVTVRGGGKGGRNQEFAFAMAQALSGRGWQVAAASIGTDGIDGPTDAAGAIVDTTTFERAAAAGIDRPDTYLHDNNTYVFFDRLGDLVRTGPTSTNVGDLQVVIVQ